MNAGNVFFSHDESRWMRSAVYKWYGISPERSSRKQITYVTRCCKSARYNENDNEVVDALKSVSSATVLAKFDGMSFEMQVRLMVDTTLLISIHGAQLTNLMFMHPGSSVIEIFNPFLKIDCYERLSKVCEMQYTAFRGTTIAAEIPIEIRKKWWNPMLNYHTVVNTTLLLPIVEHYMQ